MSRTRTILPTSSEFSTLSNNLKPLAKIKTPEGATYRFLDPFELVTKLYKTGGTQVERATAIFLAKRRPGEDFPFFIRKIPYSAYYDLTVGDQRDDRFKNATLHDLGAGVAEINNPEDHQLEIWYDSIDTIDLSEGATVLELRLIEEN